MERPTARRWIALLAAGVFALAACNDEETSETDTSTGGDASPADVVEDTAPGEETGMPDSGPEDTGPEDTGPADTNDGGDTGSDVGDTADGGMPGDTTDAGDTIGGGDAGDGGIDADTSPPPTDPSDGSWAKGFGLPGLLGESGARAYEVERGPNGNVYVGGKFNVAGQTPAENIAMWNGSRWSTLGNGIDARIEAIAFDQSGAPLAAGRATSQGVGIHRWDGSQWSPFATIGMKSSASISDMEILPSGDIVIAGSFDRVDGTSVDNLAIQTGGSWQPVSPTAQPDAPVNTIEVTGQNSFCIGGGFSSVGSTRVNNVACWTGSTWEARGKGFNSEVEDLLELPNGDLLAGGSFNFGRPPGPVTIGLARWDGTSWSPYAGGVNAGAVIRVRTLARAPNGALYVGGNFGVVGPNGKQASHVAKYHNGTWSSLGAGVVNDIGIVGGFALGVYDIELGPNGEHAVGGLFSKAGQNASLNVAQWEGSQWVSMVAQDRLFLGLSGFGQAIHTLASGELFVGGGYSSAGEKTIENAALLGNQNWSKMGKGVTGDVSAVHPDGSGGLYVGGSFRGLGPNAAADFLAHWDGSQWSQVGPNPDRPVRSLEVGPNGDLYVGGVFTSVGRTEANRIARWDGTSWHGLGKGVDSTVTDIAVGPNGDVYIGGLFTKTSGNLSTSLAHVGRWDGQGWNGVGGGTGGYVTELEFYNGDLLVGGSFQKVGRQTIHSLARWDGQSWSAFGGGLVRPNNRKTTVSALAVSPDGVFVSGTFDDLTVKGTTRTFNHLAWWDGTSWQTLGGGVNDLVEDMEVKSDRLNLAGTFTEAGSRVSYGVAVWEW